MWNVSPKYPDTASSCPAANACQASSAPTPARTGPSAYPSAISSRKRASHDSTSAASVVSVGGGFDRGGAVRDVAFLAHESMHDRLVSVAADGDLEHEPSG